MRPLSTPAVSKNEGAAARVIRVGDKPHYEHGMSAANNSRRRRGRHPPVFDRHWRIPVISPVCGNCIAEYGQGYGYAAPMLEMLQNLIGRARPWDRALFIPACFPDIGLCAGLRAE